LTGLAAASRRLSMAGMPSEICMTAAGLRAKEGRGHELLLIGDQAIGDQAKLPATVKVGFKDITYETIHDQRFREALERAGIPDRSLLQLFREYDTAPEKGQQA
jgi:hypothetical protein